MRTRTNEQLRKRRAIATNRLARSDSQREYWLRVHAAAVLELSRRAKAERYKQALKWNQ